MNNLLTQKFSKILHSPIKEESNKLESSLPKNEDTVLNNPVVKDDSKNDTFIWIKGDENSNIERKKKAMEKRMNKSKKAVSTKKVARAKSQNKIEVTSDSEVEDQMNESINQMPEPKSYNTKVNHPKFRGIKNYGHHYPIVIDLMNTQDIINVPANSSRVLESGDNPISVSSISSPSGLLNFKAFQNESAHRPKIKEPIIIHNTNASKLEGKDDALNSSLADMFKK
jgi:hypothetical protein